MIDELENRWHKACDNIKKNSEINWVKSNNEVSVLADKTFLDIAEKKLVIGVCGPGASGKSTFLNRLCKHYGFNRIINVTTRLPRKGENQNEDYRFITLEQYNTDKDNNMFVVDVQKSGRGYYGIYKEDVYSTVNNSNRIAVIESPLVLSKLFAEIDSICSNECIFCIMYFLPKEPIMSNMISHLSKREKCININTIMVEHGWRQIEEFSSLISIDSNAISLNVIQGLQIDRFADSLCELLN